MSKSQTADELTQIGIQVRAIRKELKLNQDVFAAKLGVSQSKISTVELGEPESQTKSILLHNRILLSKAVELRNELTTKQATLFNSTAEAKQHIKFRPLRWEERNQVRNQWLINTRTGEEIYVTRLIPATFQEISELWLKDYVFPDNRPVGVVI